MSWNENEKENIGWVYDWSVANEIETETRSLVTAWLIVTRICPRVPTSNRNIWLTMRQDRIESEKFWKLFFVKVWKSRNSRIREIPEIPESVTRRDFLSFPLLRLVRVTMDQSCSGRSVQKRRLRCLYRSSSRWVQETFAGATKKKIEASTVKSFTNLYFLWNTDKPLISTGSSESQDSSISC